MPRQPDDRGPRRSARWGDPSAWRVAALTLLAFAAPLPAAAATDEDALPLTREEVRRHWLIENEKRYNTTVVYRLRIADCGLRIDP